VGLDVGRDAVHGRDLDGNLGLLDGGHGEGELSGELRGEE
jgi:hypothetical protein